MNPKGFFRELKRRNVYKVAVAYANHEPLNSETRSLDLLSLVVNGLAAELLPVRVDPVKGDRARFAIR
jgi:hypothetical protein